MPSSRPSISVVTPVLNRHDTIGAAVESVASQTYAARQHIIVDGGSQDGTLDVLSRYRHVDLSSGKDRGIYDAVNRGIARAEGDLVLHLNADDLLADGALEAIADCARSQAAADAICGAATLVDMDGRPVADYSSPLYRHDRFETFLLGSPIINARVFRRHVYDRVGPYDTAFSLLSDRDFLIRTRLAGVKSAHIGRTIYVYRQHPASATFDPHNLNAGKISEEFLRLAQRWLDAPDAPADLRRICKIRYGRSAISLARLRRDRGGRLGALLSSPSGTIWPQPLGYAAMAALAWLTNEPYARP